MRRRIGFGNSRKIAGIIVGIRCPRALAYIIFLDQLAYIIVCICGEKQVVVRDLGDVAILIVFVTILMHQLIVDVA